MGTRESVLIPTRRGTTQRDMNQFPLLLLHAHKSEEKVMIILTIIVITPVFFHIGNMTSYYLGKMLLGGGR